MKYIQLFENYTAKNCGVFEFEGKKFKIRQDINNDSAFGIAEDTGEWIILAMGEEFDPVAFDMTLDQMLKFIDKGIEYFSKMKSVDNKTVEDSPYSDFFMPEIDDEIQLGKFDVLAKLTCGKENAKWNGD